MINEEPEISEPSAVEDEITEKKLPSPFVSMKKIKGHTAMVFDSTSAIYPDGGVRIITCSLDKTLRIFNLEEQKCEKIIRFSIVWIASVHFYEEEQVLMTTDWGGDLVIWKLFPRIKIVKKIRVEESRRVVLFKITQISSTEFLCCSNPSMRGCLFKIRFNENNWISEEIDYPTYNNNEKKESVRCIYQLLTQKNVVLFAGGEKNVNGEDFTIKSIDTNNNNNFQRFPLKHTKAIWCLTSFVNNSKNEEIILSGSTDQKVMFWNLKGEYLKEIGAEGGAICFLNDFSRNNIFVAVVSAGSNFDLCSFSPVSENFSKRRKLKNIGKNSILSLKWVDGEDQNTFISCSFDKTFSIFKLEEKLIDIDINKTYDCLEEMSDFQIKFRNKKINFWSTFMNNITEKDTLRKFEQLETNINEKTILSIIMGNKTKIPRNQLPDYYYFFKILNLNHCIAIVNRKIDEIQELEEIYFMFKDFCLTYENEVIKSWFSEDMQKVENFQRETFKTSFALSLFNKMKKIEITKEKGLKMIEKDKSFGTVWLHLEEYQPEEMINIMSHNDFDGVENEEELKTEYFFKKLYENRDFSSSLTLISADKKEFKVHKKILVLRYDFFFRLFKFRGLEVTEYEKTGEITLVDLMSSDVVECLIKYAYLGEVNVKTDGISAINTFCKVLIFCDQFNEKKLMKKVRMEFKRFVVSYESEKKDKNQNILRNLSELSSYLVGNDKVLGIIIPLITKLGLKVSGAEEFIEELFIQSLAVKENRDREMENKHENEKKRLREEKEESEKKLKERILELEKLVEEMKEENDKGVGKGQIREREENDEEDEEIKKEQPKRKKRKLNKK